MREDYNLRQQKTYFDYKDYSTEKLEELLRSDKFTSAVNEIIIDILDERDTSIQLDNHEKTENQNEQDTRFFYIPKSRFVILWIISFGLFPSYWIYKNWQFIRDRERPEIMPFWRGFFGIFFCHSLLNYIKNDKDLNANLKANFQSSSLATQWVIYSMLGSLLANIHEITFTFIAMAFFVLSIFSLLPVQNYINKAAC